VFKKSCQIQFGLTFSSTISLPQLLQQNSQETKDQHDKSNFEISDFFQKLLGSASEKIVQVNRQSRNQLCLPEVCSICSSERQIRFNPNATTKSPNFTNEAKEKKTSAKFQRTTTQREKI
jgi:hypothetical protein